MSELKPCRVSAACVGGHVWDVIHIPDVFRCEIGLYALGVLEEMFTAAGRDLPRNPKILQRGLCRADAVGWTNSNEGRYIALMFSAGTEEDAARRAEYHASKHREWASDKSEAEAIASVTEAT